MWRRLKQTAHEVARERPGRRFARLHARSKRDNEHYVASILYIVGGIVVVLIGIVLSISPVVPGFFLVIAGMAIIVARARPVARWLDRVELKLRRLLRRRPG